MNHNLEKLIQSLRRIKLSGEEDARMRSFLLEYMAHTPTRKSERSFVWQWLGVHRVVVYAAVLLILIIISTSATYAAEGTVPGDALYPIKIAITEPVRSAFARTPEEKAVWEVRRAERRLAEAETLAYTGRLTDKYREDIEVQLETHLERARIEAGEQEDVLKDIEETVEAILEVHEGILASLEEHDGESVEALLAMVRGRNEGRRGTQNLLTQATDADEAVGIAALSSAVETEEATTSDEEIIESKEDVSDMTPRLEEAEKQLDAVAEEVHVALDILPASTQRSLLRLLEDAEDAREDATDAYTDGRREELEEALRETLRAIRRIEAALRATVHVRRIDPELWPIDIMRQERESVPLLDDGRHDGDVQGEYREKIEESETKIEFRNR